MNHTELFKSFDKCPRLPLWVKEAAKKSILEQKLDCRNSSTLLTSFSWMDSKEKVSVWEHLHNVIERGQRFEASKVPAHWLNTPLAKRAAPVKKVATVPKKVAAAPKKLGFEDIRVCETIRACENIPGTVRQKLIAEVIDVVNGVYKKTHPKAHVKTTLSSVDSSMHWAAMPSGFKIWNAVYICSDHESSVWPW